MESKELTFEQMLNHPQRVIVSTEESVINAFTLFATYYCVENLAWWNKDTGNITDLYTGEVMVNVSSEWLEEFNQNTGVYRVGYYNDPETNIFAGHRLEPVLLNKDNFALWPVFELLPVGTNNLVQIYYNQGNKLCSGHCLVNVLTDDCLGLQIDQLPLWLQRIYNAEDHTVTLNCEEALVLAETYVPKSC